MILNTGFISKCTWVKEKKPLVIEIEMLSPGTYTLGLSGDVDLLVDWGDGTVDHPREDRPTHNYRKAGRYTITCSGRSSRLYFSGQPQLLTVKQWGTTKWDDVKFAFSVCENLRDIQADDTPDLSQTTSTMGMFYRCGIAKGNFKHWDTGAIQDMGIMFFYAPHFNEDIGNWNVKRVTNMDRMLCSASSFNRDLSNWNVSNVSYMFKMLTGAKMTPAMYDNLLIAWDKLAKEKPNCNFANPEYKKQFGISTTYCRGEAARQNLIDNHGFGTGEDSLYDLGKKCPGIN